MKQEQPTLRKMTGAELEAAVNHPALLDRVVHELQRHDAISDDTMRLVRSAVDTRIEPEEKPLEDEPMWAHRDQGVAAYCIAMGVPIRLIADLDTDYPLFAFEARPDSRRLESLVTDYKLHTLHSYRHRRPQYVNTLAIACAHAQLDRLIETGRVEGKDTIEVPSHTIWIWLPETGAGSLAR